jgi:hypothetical protein
MPDQASWPGFIPDRNPATSTGHIPALFDTLKVASTPRLISVHKTDSIAVARSNAHPLFVYYGGSTNTCFSKQVLIPSSS